MSEIFTKIGGFVASGDPLVYADSATMTGDGTIAEPFGVKTQQLFVQAPLFTGTSGTGDNTSGYIGWRPDEIVLWEGDATPTGTVTGTYSEPISNFERVRMYWRNNDEGSFKCAEYYNTDTLVYMGDVNPNLQWWKGIRVLTNTTGFTNVHCWELSLGNPSVATEVNTYHFLKLVGINRKPEA